jgi:hypothetical protein
MPAERGEHEILADADLVCGVDQRVVPHRPALLKRLPRRAALRRCCGAAPAAFAAKMQRTEADSPSGFEAVIVRRNISRPADPGMPPSTTRGNARTQPSPL